MRISQALRHADAGREPDLWPRLCARLLDDDRVELQPAAFTWPVAAAIATAVGVLFLVPDPVRFLSAFGVL